MPLFYKKEINPTTSLAIWKIEEPETFFLEYVPIKNDISHPHKRLQHLAGRYLLQYLYPDFPISSIQIADTRKPFLENEKYYFSISHCGDYAAAIVSSTERTGIDIEIVRPTVAKIAHKYLHPEELRHLFGDGLIKGSSIVPQVADADIQSKLTHLTIEWCTKEAVFKWCGLGGVDFSEMIRIDNFTKENEGTLVSHFLKASTKRTLSAQYCFFDSLCLVWVNKRR